MPVEHTTVECAVYVVLAWIILPRHAVRIVYTPIYVLARQITEAETAFKKFKLAMTPEEVLAEATRKSAVSFIIKRIQAKSCTSDINKDAR